MKHARVDLVRVDATTEQEIQAQIEEDETQAMLDVGRYVVGVRRRLGLAQAEFSRLIGVSIKTLRSWEQGKQYPDGSARSLLKILAYAPEVGLSVLR